MQIKNLIIFLSGGIVFTVLTFVAMFYMSRNVERDPKLVDTILVRVPTQGKDRYFANPKTVWGIMYVFVAFALWKLVKRGTIIVESNKLVKTTAVIVVIISIVIVALGTYLSFNIHVLDPQSGNVVSVEKVISQ